MPPHTRAPGELFPPIEPYAKGMLAVDAIHTLYWEECGNPQGTPVVFLHGGPGAGSTPLHRRFFDPAHYRIIVYDQRGSGRSEPLADIRANTTELLVQDIETLRKHRSIKRWHIFGGSWGSTLALAYAESHPDSCLSLTLRGICLLQKREIDWFLYGIRNVFPEAWNKFVAPVAAEDRHDLLSAYIRLFQSTDEDIRTNATRTWANYESSCSTLKVDMANLSSSDDSRHRTGIAIIEAHYFKNNLFTPDDQLVRNIDRIRHIPATIVHGRYDMICPIMAADELHQAWPEAVYKIIPDAGHSALEPGIRAALIEATETYKKMGD
jgi:proline iminopeptidase